MKKIGFCIFSFNRGRYLKNCVESIRSCLPEADITIFDDNSDDQETLNHLDDLKNICHIMTPSSHGKTKHGGLYLNMQAALEALSDYTLLCFLQDDTQVARPVGAEEIDHWIALFNDNPSIGFLHPCFIRGIDQKKNTVMPIEGPTKNTYYRKNNGQSAGIHYSDLMITMPHRLIAKNWLFEQSEPKNDIQAKEKFGAMLYLYSPFAMWLPDVPAYRGKKKTYALELAEKKNHCGFYPLAIWHEERAVDFINRADLTPPIAENYLHALGRLNQDKLWKYNALSGSRFLKKLNIIEVFIRRNFKVLSKNG